MKKSLYYLSFIAILISSCSSVYMPHVPSTPMLSSKGELNAGGHISLRGNASFNSAYAVSDHFGVLLSGSVMSQNGKKKDFRHNLMETGAGYFTTFGAANDRVLEIYAGLGRGSSERTFKDNTDLGLVTTERQEVSFGKYFLQVNYSSKDKKKLKLLGRSFPLNYGTAIRTSYVNMSKFVISDVKQVAEDNIFIEPVFYTRMALNRMVQLQYTSGSNFGLKNRKYLTAGSSVFTLGLVINVGGQSSNGY
ncbi:hypothetical protein GZH53_06910 [Flavihumibacter sp. R14]|nr:hypothetical protein [Flavihumibacter soli]